MAYTTINKSGDYFNTKLYTGTATSAGDTQAITGVGFQPDWVWIKNRGGSYQHVLYDAVRGVNKEVRSSQNIAEVDSGANGYLSGFDSDGFTTNAGTNEGNHVNNTGDNFVSWNWKANGAGSTNTDGSINSTVSVNTTAGFSIVKWTPTNTNTPQTIGHGLGVAPSMIIVKNIQRAVDWKVYHKSIGNTHALTLNGTNAKHDDNGYWEDTTPTSTVFTTGNGAGYTVGAVTENFIAYCFRDVVGYSKFGSYGGNQNADGNFIYLGFKPAFVMIKRYSAGNPTTTNWNIFDTKRDGYNGKNENLFPNTSDAESSGNNRIDMLSNGFKLRTTTADINNNGHNYIYMAFASAPLVGTNNVPCTAR